MAMKIKELDDGAESIIENKRSRNNDTRLIAVRVDTKRALVGAGAGILFDPTLLYGILFDPTLLYNLFRNKIQAEFRWWHQIDQRTEKLAGTVNWGTAMVVGVFTGMLYGGSKAASASVQ